MSPVPTSRPGARYTRSISPIAPKADLPDPIQNFQLSKKDLEDPSLGRLNVMLQQLIQRVNQHSGVSGPTVLPSGVDVKGKTVTGLGTPVNPTDAISSDHAKSQYSAPVLAPQFDVGGSSALKGLASVYGQTQPGMGVSQKITVPKLTTAEGFIEFSNGIITGYQAPT
jgi:hypothetical protein